MEGWMRIFAACIAAAASFGAISLAAPHAEAKDIAKHLVNCKKATGFSTTPRMYQVPDSTGQLVAVTETLEHWRCDNKINRQKQELTTLTGLQDSAGKIIVPVKYSRVVPYSSQGAVVRSHEGQALYTTYTAGKGEGKEKYDFQEIWQMEPSPGCLTPPVPTLQAVVGTYAFSVGGGRVHITIFTPDGKAKRMEHMGGDGHEGRALQRVGDVLLARWYDEKGAKRSGILDIYGNQIAPVFGNAQIWTTYGSDERTRRIKPPCLGGPLSTDLFFEGPSLDDDPSQAWYGPLLIPAGPDGRPVVLPPGAAGMFAAPLRDPYLNKGPRGTYVWSVVYPTATGFEFTLHTGTPAEAIAAAPNAPRYVSYRRTQRYDLIVAQSASDKVWRTFDFNGTSVLGQPGASFQLAGDSAVNLLLARAQADQAARQAELAAQEQQRRADEEKRLAAYRASLDAIAGTPRYCDVAMPTTVGPSYMESWLDQCAAKRLGMNDLYLAKTAGVPEATLTRARAEWDKGAEQRAREAGWAKAAELDRLKGSSTYIPGQWDTALRLAGDAWVSQINQSAENRMQARNNQYIADWQRSQRAY